MLGVCRSQAFSFRLRHNMSWSFSQRTKVAESVVLVVDIVRPVERLKVWTLQYDLLVTWDSSKIWINCKQRRFIEVKVVVFLQWILLSIQRHGKRHRSINDIWLWSSAPKIPAVYKMSLSRLCSKVASKVVTQVDEVLTPNLNDCVTVFRTISWVDASDMKLIIVSVGQTAWCIVKVSCERYCQGDNLGMVIYGRSIALDTNAQFFFFASLFFVVKGRWLFRALDVVSIDNFTVFAKLALWIGIGLNKRTKIAHAHRHLSISSDWAASWC